MARLRRDGDFRRAMFCEAVRCIIVEGDLAIGRSVLRDFVNATLGFQELARRTKIPIKSLMRMLGPVGSPSAVNLVSILMALQEAEGVRFEVSVKPAKTRRPRQPRAQAGTGKTRAAGGS